MSLSVESLGGNVMHMTQECSHCLKKSRTRRREFSEQAWAALVVWGEVENSAVDNPLCQNCYEELRELLISRADEMEAASKQPAPKPGKKTVVAAKKKKAPAAKKKAAKAPKKKVAKRTSKVA